MRQSIIVNNILLSKKQKLFVHYHPLNLINHANNDEYRLPKDYSKEKITNILEGLQEGEFSNLDEQLIQQLIGKPEHLQQTSSLPPILREGL